jgi:hypothetical protein
MFVELYLSDTNSYFECTSKVWDGYAITNKTCSLNYTYRIQTLFFLEISSYIKKSKIDLMIKLQLLQEL